MKYFYNPVNNKTLSLQGRDEIEGYILGMSRNQHVIVTDGFSLYGLTSSVDNSNGKLCFDLIMGDGWEADRIGLRAAVDNLYYQYDKNEVVGEQKLSLGGYSYILEDGLIVRDIEPLDHEYYEDFKYDYSSIIPGRYCKNLDAGCIPIDMRDIYYGERLTVSVTDGNSVNIAIITKMYSPEKGRHLLAKSAEGLEMEIYDMDDVWEFMIRFQPRYSAKIPLYMTLRKDYVNDNYIGADSLHQYHVTTTPDRNKVFISATFKDGVLSKKYDDGE